MEGTIRPEITAIINDIQNIINGFEAFKSNYDDDHYDVFKEALVMFAQGIERIISIPAFTLQEKEIVKPFLKTHCLAACETLREYEIGRRNFLKVDYDIAAATAVSIAPSSEITETRQNIDDKIDDLSQGEQRQTADIIPIGLAAQQQPQQAEIEPIHPEYMGQEESSDMSQSNEQSNSQSMSQGRALTMRATQPNHFRGYDTSISA